MLSLRSSMLFCSSIRSFSKSFPYFERFSRESLRNRVYKQNWKDFAKQSIQNPGTSISAPIVDSIPVRPARDLWKAFGFTLLVGGGSFILAIMSDSERAVQQVKSFQQVANEYFNSFRTTSPSPEEAYVTWDKLSLGDKHCLYLVGANLLVLCLWRIKPLQSFMWRYFSNSFASKSLCLPMLLSAFSHSNLLHFGLNMYVVYSFANLAIDKFLGVDQFWAFYCTAAVVSSLTSLMHKSAVRSSIRALGASGAILALLTYTCMKIPEARLRILFVPFFDFSAQAAVIGILLFDLCGLLFRFRLFDHAAHLGGSLFGILYALFGEHLIWHHYGGAIEDWYKRIRNKRND